MILSILNDDKPIMGVYAIKCVKSGYTYIGASVNVQRRIIDHLGSVRDMSGPQNIHFNREFSKYSPFSFVVFLLETCDNKFQLREREQFYIDNVEKTYNKLPATFAPRRNHLKHSPIGRYVYENGMTYRLFANKSGISSPELYRAYAQCAGLDEKSINVLSNVFGVDKSVFVTNKRDNLRKLVGAINNITSPFRGVFLDFDSFMERSRAKTIDNAINALHPIGMIKHAHLPIVLTEFGEIVKKKVIRAHARKTQINKP